MARTYRAGQVLTNWLMGVLAQNKVFKNTIPTKQQRRPESS